MRTLTIVLLTAMISTTTVPETAAQFFRDDFDDSATDGNPVTWVPEAPPWPVGEQRVEGGSLILTPSRNAFPGPNWYETDWEVEADFPTDLVLRTQVRAMGESGQEAYHTIYARDTTREDAQQGVYTGVVLSTTGYLALLVGDNLDNTFLRDGNFSSLTTRAHDINLELWLSGQNMEVFAWRDGDERPTTPRLSAVSPLKNVTVGRVGVGFAHEVDIPSISGAFRYVEVTPVPEPSTLGLLALGGVALCSRRPRAS